MTATTPTISRQNTDTDAAYLVTWASMGNVSGTPITLLQLSNRTIHIAGTFDSATVVLEGSNDGTNYITLRDTLGNALSFTSTGLKKVHELPLYVRPTVSGGGGSVSINAYLLVAGVA